MTSVAPALRPSPCPSDQQELASRSRSPVTRKARPRHGAPLGRAEARQGPCAAAAEGRLVWPHQFPFIKLPSAALISFSACLNTRFIARVFPFFFLTGSGAVGIPS